MKMERLPLNANGKVDRRALPPPSFKGSREGLEEPSESLGVVKRGSQASPVLPWRWQLFLPLAWRPSVPGRFRVAFELLHRWSSGPFLPQS